MRINPYLSFNGDCEAAFRLYEKVLGGRITMMMTFGESPMASEVPPERRLLILHTTLAVGDSLLQGADVPPGTYQKPQGTSVTISLDDAAHAERVFRALAEGGTVQMPLQHTFWARRFGMVTDRFGTPWLINCGNPQ